jgi:hypothetical protein
MSPTGASDGRPRILVVEANLKDLGSLALTLKATVGNVESREWLDALPEEGEFDLVVANYDDMPPGQRQAVQRHLGDPRSKTRLLLLSAGKATNELGELFKDHHRSNVLARNNAQIDFEELIVTSRKLLDHDIFGLEKYFWSVKPQRIIVTKSSDKAAVLAAADAYTTSLGVNPRFASLFAAVADEFVTNAVYNAPVDPQGRFRFAHHSRTHHVALDPGEEVEVKLCCDGRRLGISASDPFGSLKPERLDHLSKGQRRGNDQVDMKEGGAGLGFYLIFDALSHFIVNLSPGKKTEMIGLIDIHGSFRDFASKHKSFNVFSIGDHG